MEERQESGEEIEHGKRFCNNSEHKDYSALAEHDETSQSVLGEVPGEGQRVLEENRGRDPCRVDELSEGVGDKKAYESPVAPPCEKADAPSPECSVHVQCKHSNYADLVNKSSTSDGSREDLEENKPSIFEGKGEFVPGKIPAPSESIFSKPGVQKQKKDSSFLSKSYAEDTDNATKVERSEGEKSKTHWHKGCRLSYFEEGDCMDIGAGEAHIRDHSLVFVRDLFKAVILNVPCKSTEFKREKHSVFFRAKSRKSTGESFEIAEREYVMEFHNEDAAEELLNEARK